MKQHVVGVIVGGLVMASCAVVGPAGSGARTFESYGVFKTYDMGPNLFRISVTGNGYTTPESADELALLEASRVSIGHQCRYFTIIDQPVHSTQPAPSPQVRISIGADWGYGGHRRHRDRFGGPWGDWGWGGPVAPYYGDYNNQPQFASTSMTIKCSGAEPPTDSKSPPAFDAYTILRSLGPKYHLGAIGADTLPATLLGKASGS